MVSPAKSHPTCQQPDRDVPKIRCGYPLPCPWHTVVVVLRARSKRRPIASKGRRK